MSPAQLAFWQELGAARSCSPASSLPRPQWPSPTSGHRHLWWSRRDGLPAHARANLGRKMLRHHIPQCSPTLPGRALSLGGPGVIFSTCVSMGHQWQTRRPHAGMETPPVQQR